MKEIIINQFVPFEIADALLDKGFNEDCLGYYESRNNTLIVSTMSFYELEKYNLGILAPTFQQVIDWIKSKGILITELWNGWEYAKLEEDFTYVQTKEQAIEHALTLI